MSTRVHLFCPFCNAKGASQPILSPMTCVYILGRPESEGAGAKGQPQRGSSHFEYRCTRCGYTEIHEKMLDEAA